MTAHLPEKRKENDFNITLLTKETKMNKNKQLHTLTEHDAYEDRLRNYRFCLRIFSTLGSLLRIFIFWKFQNDAFKVSLIISTIEYLVCIYLQL